MTAASREVDEPGEPRLSYADAVARLEVTFPGFGPAAHWVAREDGDIVAVAVVDFPGGRNDHVAVVEIVVHPRRRRRGIGTAMLAALEPGLRSAGRRVVEGWGVVRGGPGEPWSRALGFEPVRAVAVQRLVMATVDRSRWPDGAPEGYRLRRWLGTAPPDILATYVRARGSIHDAPLGGTEVRPADWTESGVRRAEAQMREQGIEQRIAVAVEEATGEVAGLTELIVHPSRPTWGYQGDTAVVPPHRGRGLGRCVKAHLARWLVAERPDLEGIQTSTSADNTYMIRVNHQLGYTTDRVLVTVRRELTGAPVRE